MKAQQQDLQHYSKHMNEVLAWLETINKSNKSTPREPLEQQLQTLSLSNKNAQQKLLSLEKQLNYESIHNEKQRSIIELLKYFISGSLDDETILTYLVEMQDSYNKDIDSKYEIKSDLEEIKEIFIKRKNSDKKADSLKNAAINDLKKELIRCNQTRKQLMEDLDRLLDEKSNLQIIVQKQENQIKMINEEKNKLMGQIQILKQNESRLIEENNNLKSEISAKSSSISQKEEAISKMKVQINRIIKGNQQSIESEKDIFRCLKKLSQKLEKYRNAVKQMNQKLKKQSLSSDLINSMKVFLPDEALKLYDQFQKTGQRCLIKQMEGIAQLQRKKYRQLQSCQEEVWRLKQRLLREGSWKCGKTVASISNNKENCNPNYNASQKVSQFEAEELNAHDL